MSKKNILILGAGEMQKPAINAAHELGWKALVVDVNPHASAIAMADDFKQADLKSIDEVLQAALLWKKEVGLDGVFTAGTDFSYTVASVAKKLGLPGLAPQVALNATDKALMRQCFLDSAVSSPRFIILSGESDWENDFFSLLELSSLKFPLVVKPADNMGGRGIRRVDSKRQLRKAISVAISFSRSGKVVIEQYVSGPEFSLEALVVNGEVLVTGFADRHIYFDPYFIEMGHSMPTIFSNEVQTKVIDEFKKAIKALGIDNGVAKGDIKYQQKLNEKGEVFIGEIAARLSGGYMSGWTFPYATSYPLTKQALRLAGGEVISLDPVCYHQCVVERAFISIPGTIEKIQYPLDLTPYLLVKDFFLRVKRGDLVDLPVNNVEKSANVIAVGKTRERAEKAATDFLKEVVIRLDIYNKDTFNYLLAHSIDNQYQPYIKHRFKQSIKNNKDGRKGFILFQLVPRYKDRVMVFSFNIDKMELDDNWRDWHGLNWDQFLIAGRRSNLFQSVGAGRQSQIFDLSLFTKVIDRGGLQGLIWLMDYINQVILPSCIENPMKTLKIWLKEQL